MWPGAAFQSGGNCAFSRVGWDFDQFVFQKKASRMELNKLLKIVWSLSITCSLRDHFRTLNSQQLQKRSLNSIFWTFKLEWLRVRYRAIGMIQVVSELYSRRAGNRSRFSILSRIDFDFCSGCKTLRIESDHSSNSIEVKCFVWYFLKVIHPFSFYQIDSKWASESPRKRSALFSQQQEELSHQECLFRRELISQPREQHLDTMMDTESQVEDLISCQSGQLQILLLQLELRPELEWMVSSSLSWRQ